MKIGLLSDAHGNPEGLANCISYLEQQGVEKIFFLGDAIGYLPRWAEVLEILKRKNIFCLLGNHDACLFDEKALPNLSAAYQIFPEYIKSIASYVDWISSWPSSYTETVDGKKLMFVHGSPMNLTGGYVYPWSDKSEFATVNADVFFMGNTHRPFVEHIGEKLLINVGSCGLPRDHGGLSSCAIYDSASMTCDVFRIPFDIDDVIAQSPDIHPSVEDCLHRTAEDFYGKVVIQA
ncbi:Uncharacterized conserved protein [Janthinobacterium sp. Marseille]|nr:metallophosphoesterase family protein [Janthinobacterium sp. Marseille]ABR91666.1 Uncharacterized conserved protein [Janthinobacterium sp. Marseille]